MPALNILYEDNHLIAINKRSGEISQGDKTGDSPLGDSVKKYLKEKYLKPGNVYLGLVHRLDRPVSGVIVFARTSKSAARMAEKLRSRTMQKIYWAVVKKLPENTEGTLTHYLIKNEKLNRSVAHVAEKPGSRIAILHYKLIASIDNYYLLEVRPETGRHHQIRVQLSTIGSPIRGDLKYGFDRTNKDGSIHLHARQIEFEHPVTAAVVCITAPPPEDIIWNSFMKMLA